MSTTTTSNLSWGQRFAQNAENQLQSGSTYALAVGLGFLALLASWPDLAKAIDGIPLLHGYGAGIAVIVTTLVTKFRPSGAITTQMETALIEIARLRANEVMKKNGLNLEIPQAPAASALPTVPIATVIPGAVPPDLVNRSTAPVPPTPAWAETRPVPEFGTSPGVSVDLMTATSITPAPPPITPAPSPITTAVDVDITAPVPPIAPAPSPQLPIDHRLLLTLVKQYLEQVDK